MLVSLIRMSIESTKLAIEKDIISISLIIFESGFNLSSYTCFRISHDGNIYRHDVMDGNVHLERSDMNAILEELSGEKLKEKKVVKILIKYRDGRREEVLMDG